MLLWTLEQRSSLYGSKLNVVEATYTSKIAWMKWREKKKRTEKKSIKWAPKNTQTIFFVLFLVILYMVGVCKSVCLYREKKRKTSAKTSLSGQSRKKEPYSKLNLILSDGWHIIHFSKPTLCIECRLKNPSNHCLTHTFEIRRFSFFFVVFTVVIFIYCLAFNQFLFQK